MRKRLLLRNLTRAVIIPIVSARQLVGRIQTGTRTGRIALITSIGVLETGFDLGGVLPEDCDFLRYSIAFTYAYRRQRNCFGSLIWVNDKLRAFQITRWCFLLITKFSLSYLFSVGKFTD